MTFLECYMNFIVSYFSWLECHPDKMEVVGSSPIETTWELAK